MKGKINRRNLILGGSASAVAAVSALSNSSAFAVQDHQQDKAKPAPPKDGDEAMTRLLAGNERFISCLLYTSPSPRDQRGSRMPSSA